MIYYGVYLTLLIAQLFSELFLKTRRYIFFYALIGLFIFCAFRFEVGCDWIIYEIVFNYDFSKSVQVANLLSSGEVSSAGLILLAKYFDLPFVSMNIFTSIFFFSGLSYLALRQPSPVAFLVYCFPILIINMPMSGIRQAAAIGFVCVALVAFCDKRFFLYLFSILLAMTFHVSAGIFLLLLPFVKSNISRKGFLIMLLVGAVIVLGYLITGSIQLYILRYFETEVSSAGAIYRLGLLFFTGAMFLFWLAKKWEIKFHNDYKLAYLGAIAMLLLPLLMIFSSPIADRFGYYLIPFQAMILARIRFIPDKFRQINMIWPPLFLFFVFLVWSQYSSHFQSCYLPYRNWF